MKNPRLTLTLLAAAVLALTATTAPASASRALLTEHLLDTSVPPSAVPPPEGEIEGACGLAFAPGGPIYVSDYYHRTVDLFSAVGDYQSQIALPGSNPFFGTNTLDAVCGLALDSSGRLYGNELHQGVLRLAPGEAVIDGEQSTGVAVDAAGNLYVDDRTYVAKYAVPVVAGDKPVAKLGLGSLADAYGLAVSPSGARIYVADAADHTVKVFEPAAARPDLPVGTITGFNSLRNAALAVDPSNGHLLVLDDLQPGYESPEAAFDEFDSSGILVDQITHGIVDGGPSGLTVGSAGTLFVTSGNSENSNVLEFGPYVAAGASPVPASAPQAPAAGPPQPTVEAASENNGGPSHPAAKRAAAASEVIQRGGVRVAVQAKLTPKKLPRTGAAPVYFSLSAKIASTDGSIPPQLRGLEIEINRHGSVNPAGLPACRIEQIQPATTKAALEACRPSLVGDGNFSAKVLLTQQAPFPSAGEVVAFNGRWHGKPAVLAHIYGTKPVPTSYTLPFVVSRVGQGTYGTALKASLPSFTSKWGYVTGISLNLGRRTSRGGYLTAGCPAPKGFGSASFPLARASLSFSTGPKEVDQTLTRSCGVR